MATKTKVYTGQELIAPDAPNAEDKSLYPEVKPRPYQGGEYFPLWHHLSADVLKGPEYAPAMYFCWDYVYWQLLGRRGTPLDPNGAVKAGATPPQPYGSINGVSLRDLLSRTFHYAPVPELAGGTLDDLSDVPRLGKLRAKDVLIMGKGGGGHTVWVENPSKVSHLLQALSGSGVFHDEGKPIPLTMVVALENHSSYNKKEKADRFLPNVRFYQPLSSLRTMCSNYLHQPLEVWRAWAAMMPAATLTARDGANGLASSNFRTFGQASDPKKRKVPFTFSKPAGRTRADVHKATIFVDVMLPAGEYGVNVTLRGAGGRDSPAGRQSLNASGRITVPFEVLDPAVTLPNSIVAQTEEDWLTALFAGGLQGVVDTLGVVYGVSLKLE
jgi:hypothetical protein